MIFLDAETTHFLGDGQDEINHGIHHAIAKIMLRRAEDSHVATAGDEGGPPTQLGNEASPEIRGLVKRVNDFHFFVPDEFSNLASSLKRVPVVGTTQGQDKMRARKLFK